MKEIKVDINKWGKIPCSWIRRFNTLNRLNTLQTHLCLNKIPKKILANIFVEIEKPILKFIAKTMLKKKNKVQGLTF